MLLKKIIYFIIVLLISSIYPVYQYTQNDMAGIDAFTTTIIIFAIIHILYKINTHK